MDLPAHPQKLRVGWFTFTCCEDSTVVFTELMNDHWQEWKQRIDFRHARVLQSHNVLDHMHVAFVEGAISSQQQLERLQEIRKNADRLVAIGACAVVGMPSAQRNDFDESRQQEIQHILDRFAYLPKVQKLSEVVAVDANVPGCPMIPETFLAVLTQALKDFAIPMPTHAHR